MSLELCTPLETMLRGVPLDVCTPLRLPQTHINGLFGVLTLGLAAAVVFHQCFVNVSDILSRLNTINDH